jgi:DNA-binding transcriptional ArsR family regulator
VNDQAILDRRFQALAHPARRTILSRVAAGETSVGQAGGGLGLTKPAVSKHVRLLEEAGLLRRTVVGRQHVLRLEGEAFLEAARWLERHRRLWEAKLDEVDRFLAEQR